MTFFFGDDKRNYQKIKELQKSLHDGGNSRMIYNELQEILNIYIRDGKTESKVAKYASNVIDELNAIERARNCRK